MLRGRGPLDTFNNFLETRNLMELTIPLEPLETFLDTLDTIYNLATFGETFGSKVSDTRPYAHSIFDPLAPRCKIIPYERSFFFSFFF